MSFSRAPKISGEAGFVGSITTRRDIALHLIFGPDTSVAADIAAQLAAQLGAGAQCIDMDSEKIRNDPAFLADEACSPSLFGDARYIRLTINREEGIAAIENLLASQGGCPVIATAGDLKKTSKLRKLAESSPRVLCHICYPPSEAEATAAIVKMATTQGLRLDRVLAQRIAHYTGADRKLAAMEVEKLVLYYDTAPDRPATVEPSIFDMLSAETDEENVGDLVNLVMSGNMAKLGAELISARQMGVDAIRIIRAVQRRVNVLASMRAKVDTGGSPDRVVEANRAIFYKERGAMANQLSRWPSVRLAGLNSHLIDTEARLMRVKAEIGDVILEQELTRVARAVARG